MGRFKVFWTKLKCLIVGWNYEILKTCGESSYRQLNKYICGISILTIIWSIIGYTFADRYIGFDSVLPKMITSLVFIILVMSIERFIILNNNVSNWIIFVRVALAILMATLGASIFDQIIFKNDIEVKMKEIRDNQINERIPERLKFLETDINRTIYLVDSLGRENILLYEKISKNPTTRVTDISSEKKYIGTDSLGNPMYKEEQHKSTRHIENPLLLRAKNNDEMIKSYESRLQEYQKEKMNMAQIVREEYENAEVGFLEELEALVDLISERIVALVFYFVLFAFLMLLETLTLFSRSGDSCDYELIINKQLHLKTEMLDKMSKEVKE